MKHVLEHLESGRKSLLKTIASLDRQSKEHAVQVEKLAEERKKRNAQLTELDQAYERLNKEMQMADATRVAETPCGGKTGAEASDFVKAANYLVMKNGELLDRFTRLCKSIENTNTIEGVNRLRNDIQLVRNEIEDRMGGTA